jgi:hypothetical protein
MHGLGLAVAATFVVGGVSASASSVRPTSSAVPDRVATDVVDRSDRIEALKLDCHGVDRDEAAIACRWSIPEHPRAAAVKLYRSALGTDEARTVVFRTDDLEENSYVDSPIRRGVRYLYAIRVVDVNGRIVGASRPVIAGVPPVDQPEIEVLKLACAAASASVATCEWSLPDRPARVLTLWRSVDGGPRERVASFEQRFPTTYRDEVPEGTRRAAYAVIATTGDTIVARSRASYVRFADEPDTDVRPVDTRPVDTRPVDTRPLDTRPVDTKPVDTRPLDTRPVDTKPVDTRPLDTRPVDTKPVDTRPDEPTRTSIAPSEEGPVATTRDRRGADG